MSIHAAPDAACVGSRKLARLEDDISPDWRNVSKHDQGERRREKISDSAHVQGQCNRNRALEVERRRGRLPG